MLSVTRYAGRWRLIATTGELEASAVKILAPNPKKKGVLSEHLVLVHKRRVTESQAAGREESHICFGFICPSAQHLLFKIPGPGPGPGPWSLVLVPGPGPWSLVPGPGSMVPGPGPWSWSLVTGPRYRKSI